MRLLASLTLVIWVALVSFAQAQDKPPPDFAAWDKLATQAEQILQSGNANDARLDDIRAQVAKWRDQFQGAEGTNSTRIATLKDQIAALGPAPAEGQTESEDIAARRTELGKQLSELQAPGLAAVEAYGRADGIIQQIDRTQRARQTSKMLQLAPSPLNPANWAVAVQDGYKLLAGIGSELHQRFTDQGGWSSAKKWAPSVLIILGMALLLLTKGRRWIDTLPSRLSKRTSDRTRAVVVFAVSLGQILVPVAGVVLVVIAIAVTELLGEWTEPIVLALPGAALTLFGGVWLTKVTFPNNVLSSEMPLPLRENHVAQQRFNGTMLSLSLALTYVVASSILPSVRVAQNNALQRVPLDMTPASVSVWYLPFILFGAYFLFRLCRILRRLNTEGENESTNFRLRIVMVLGGIGQIVAVASVVLVCIGYVQLANSILWPTILSLALFALLLNLQDFIADLYAMAKGGGTAARDALMPVLIGIALICLSIPIFAIIWGTRDSELSEIWGQLKQGISVGGITISPTGILTFVIVFGIGFAITRLIQGALSSTILPKTRIDAGGKNAIVSGIGYVGIILALVLAVTGAGINLSSLAFVAGALSVGIGFGMQNIVSNFVSGIILLIERPITVGDWIQVGNNQGIVKRIAVRSTHLQTFDRTEVIVPNTDLIAQSVTNWTRNNLSGRIIVPIGVAYGTDTRKVEKILLEIAEDQPTVSVNPAPAVIFKGFGADSMNFEIRAIVADINAGTQVSSEINHAIARRFAEEDIEIPFPQRDVWVRSSGGLAVTEPKARPQLPPDPGPQQKPMDPRTLGVLPLDDHVGKARGDADDDGDDGDGGDGGGYGSGLERR